MSLDTSRSVLISGETIEVAALTSVKTGAILDLDNLSGGTVLHSGTVKAVILKAKSTNSGIVYVGGSGVERPYTGYGFELEAGDGITLDVNNFDAVYVMSSISGYGIVSYIGVN